MRHYLICPVVWLTLLKHLKSQQSLCDKSDEIHLSLPRTSTGRFLCSGMMFTAVVKLKDGRFEGKMPFV